MEDQGTRIVFLIHPNTENLDGSDKKIWQDTVLNAVARILTYFRSASSNQTKWNHESGNILKSEDNLRWGYKFASKPGIKFHSLNDFKALSLANLDFFREEVKVSCEDDEKIDYSSHTLVDNLIAMIHDFQWEQLQIISPVKRTRKEAYTKRTLAKNHTSNITSAKAFLQAGINGNYVFIVGPLPKTQDDVNAYFEWTINSVDEIEGILMPKHLAEHFIDKHTIKLYWLDTQKPIVKTLGNSTLNIGLSLMDQFLKSSQGCVIPISLLGKEFRDVFGSSIYSKTSMPHESLHANKASSHLDRFHNLSALDDTVGSDAVFEEDVTDMVKKPSLYNAERNSPFATSLTMKYFFEKNLSLLEECAYTGNIYFVDTINKERNILVKLHPTADTCLSHSDLFSIVKDSVNFTPKFKNIDITGLINRLNMEETSSIDKSLEVANSLPSHLLSNVSDVIEQECSSTLVQHQPSKLKVVGQIRKSAICSIVLCGSSLLCVDQPDSVNLKELIIHLRKHGLVLLMESDCIFCCSSESSFSPSCSLFHHYGILQPLNDKCASLSWQRNDRKQRIIKLFAACFNKKNLSSREVKEFIEKAAASISDKLFLENDDTSLESLFLSGGIASYQSFMLESWYNCSASSNEFQRFSEISKRFTSNSSITMEPKDIQFRDAVLSELQGLYKTESSSPQQQQNASNFPNFERTEPLNTKTGFASWTEVESFITTEQETFVNDFTSRIESICHHACSIVNTICSYIQQTNATIGTSTVLELIEEKLSERIFFAASNVRTKDITPERKCFECMVQVLYRFEWFSFKAILCKEMCDFTESEVDDVTQLLRAISLSAGMEKMREFLQGYVVDRYSSKCGRLIAEVLSDMMLPLPEILKHLVDTGVDESVLSSVSSHSSKFDQPLSTGPFSTLSSVGSRGSNDSRSNDRPRRIHRSAQIQPAIARQIVVHKAEKMKDSKRKRSSVVETVKQRLFTSNSANTRTRRSDKTSIKTDVDNQKKPKKKSVTVSDEVIRVRRDLFASPSKPRRRLNSTNDENSSRAAKPLKKERTASRKSQSVIDTPAAKQKMTALARQRLRQRRSWEAQEKEEINTTVVEESPIKSVDSNRNQPANIEAKDKKSPRHAIMLARRHSFYRDGMDAKCRTVARAQVIQQHSEAVPPTPRVGSASFKSEDKDKPPLFSPKSLLFSYMRSNGNSETKQKNQSQDLPASLGRSRRRLKLVSEVSNTAKENPGINRQRKSDSCITLHEPDTSPATSTCLLSLGTSGDFITTQSSINNPISFSKVDLTFDLEPSASLLSHKSTHAPVTSESTAGIIITSNVSPVCEADIMPFQAYSKKPSIGSNEEISVHSTLKEPPLDTPSPPKLTRHKKQPSALSEIVASPPELTSMSPMLVRRSPRIARKLSTVTPLKSPPSLKKVGPLDQFVVRTPTSCNKTKTLTSPVVAPKRKPSPIGDHIQRWPRKKRLSDTTSPVLSAKRRKKFSSETKNTVISPIFESSDDGAYIVTGNERSQTIRKVKPAVTDEVSPGIEVAQLLKSLNPSEKTSTRKNEAHSRKHPSAQLLDEMGVFPITDKGESPFRRWTSPRRKPQGKLFHARLGSPSSARRVPMMMLFEDSD